MGGPYKKEIKAFLRPLGLKTKAEKQLVRAITRYVLRLTPASTLRETGQRLGVHKELHAFKKRYLDLNKYPLAHVWRAIHMYFGGPECWRCYVCEDRPLCRNTKRYKDWESCDNFHPSMMLIGNEFGVDFADMKYIIERVMSDKDKTKLRRIVHENSMNHFKIIPELEMLSEIEPHIRNLVGSQKGGVLFVYRYNNYDRADAVRDLQLQALQIALRLDMEMCKGNRLKFINTIKAGLTNHCMNMIKAFNRKKRARIIQEDGKFLPRLVSMNDVTEDGLTVESKIGADSDEITLIEESHVIERLAVMLSPNQIEFIEIVLGGGSDAFYAWAEQRHPKDGGFTITELRQLAKRYLELTEDEIKEIGRKYRYTLSSDYIAQEDTHDPDISDADNVIRIDEVRKVR